MRLLISRSAICIRQYFAGVSVENWPLQKRHAKNAKAPAIEEPPAQEAPAPEVLEAPEPEPAVEVEAPKTKKVAKTSTKRVSRKTSSTKKK